MGAQGEARALVEELYNKADWWTEENTSMLCNPSLPCWNERDRMLVEAIKSNGIGKMLWVASHYIWGLVKKVREMNFIT